MTAPQTISASPDPRSGREHGPSTAGSESSAAPRSTAAKAAARWDDQSLRTKLTTLIALSCVWGVAVGTWLGQLEMPWWMRLAAILTLFGGLALLSHHWIARPLDHFLWQLRRINSPDRPLSTSGLPRDRRDEIGQISRTLHDLQVASLRDHHEANRLRRELDDRITSATRKATSELQQMAMRDPLTNLGNRRFLDAHFPRVIQSCTAARTELTVVVMDLDNFKLVNDELGHATGDEMIKLVADLIRSGVRNEDLAVRLGGDEFAIVMPACNTDQAETSVQRLRSLFREHVHRTLPPNVQPDISFGIASLHRDGAMDAKRLMHVADERLYHNKSGRERA